MGDVPPFTVRMGAVTLGSSDLEGLDGGMGVAAGAFRPGPGCARVRAVVRLFAEAEGKTSARLTDHAKLARYYAERDRLGLTLHGPVGVALPTAFIHIADYSVEAGQDAIRGSGGGGAPGRVAGHRGGPGRRAGA